MCPLPVPLTATSCVRCPLHVPLHHALVTTCIASLCTPLPHAPPCPPLITACTILPCTSQLHVPLCCACCSHPCCPPRCACLSHLCHPPHCNHDHNCSNNTLNTQPPPQCDHN